MTLTIAVLLGVIEGVTEFLPISSTAHLILASSLFGLPQTEFLKAFEVVIQLGAILAAVVVYWGMVVRHPEIIWKILAAFVPTAIIGFVLHDFVKNVLFESVATILWTMLIGGIFLVVFETLHQEKKDAVSDLRRVTYGQAVVIGLFQSLALIPGLSRSTAVIIGGLTMGLSLRTIVDFAFLLAIPTMAAATGLDLLKSASAFSAGDVSLLIAGFVTAFVVAWAVIRWFLGYIKRHSFIPFGIYRVILAVGLLLLGRI